MYNTRQELISCVCEYVSNVIYHLYIIFCYFQRILFYYKTDFYLSLVLVEPIKYLILLLPQITLTPDVNAFWTNATYCRPLFSCSLHNWGHRWRWAPKLCIFHTDNVRGEDKTPTKARLPVFETESARAQRIFVLSCTYYVHLGT